MSDYNGFRTIVRRPGGARSRLRTTEGSIKTLAQQMAVYAAYHRNPLNRMTHFVGVPLIMFSLLVPFSWLELQVPGVRVTGAMILVAAVLIYYFLLDIPLAAAMTVFTILLLGLAHWVAVNHSAETGWIVFAGCFIGGWILQLVGHVFEGRRPALTDNFWQVFVAPIFLMAEVFFALGFRTGIRDQVRARAERP